MFAVLSSPCPVERLWRFSVFADSFVIVTTLSTSDANKQCGCKCQPWFYLRLVAYSFFWLSEGAYGLSRDWRCSEQEPRSSPEMNLGRKVLDQALKLLVVLDIQRRNALLFPNQ
jgi:hypothetical protein